MVYKLVAQLIAAFEGESTGPRENNSTDDFLDFRRQNGIRAGKYAFNDGERLGVEETEGAR